MRTLCLVVHAYFPLAEPRVERAAVAARDGGWRVVVIALRGEGEAARQAEGGIEVIRLPIRHLRGASFVRILFEYLSFTLLATVAVVRLTMQTRIDAIHVSSPPDFLILSALPARVRGARVLLDVHDISSHMFGVRFRARRVAALLLAIITRAAAAASDAVVTVHEPYRRELVATGVPAAKVHVVMNSPDEALIRAVAPARSVAGPFTIGYHGTVTHWYGVDLVLDAAALLTHDLPELRVSIIGDGDALPALRGRAEELGIADRVVFSGRYVSLPDALAAIARCNCGVVPNRESELNRFALSSKLLEYTALHIPAVVARLETLSAYFGDDEVTFFDPGDVSSLADAIRWIAQHPEAAAARAARAARRGQEYAWSEQRSRYLSLLEPA